ncbi:MAG: hypothetical protein IJH63_10225 [Methanobrevibacter sp.]|nr:hypothetical protein [Methanosphaera sp.]MBR0371075.1 hypothetical protein [Methanobrevibacter sp.]
MMKQYIIVFHLSEDCWALYEFNPVTNNPRGEPILVNDESLYELVDEAREYGVVREAIVGKCQDNMVPCFE